jgi:CheY-like chemotaxis protein
VTENGPEAVNVARQAAPDIILLRAELPLTTGFSVCNRLRRNEDTKQDPAHPLLVERQRRRH